MTVANYVTIFVPADHRSVDVTINMPDEETVLRNAESREDSEILYLPREGREAQYVYATYEESGCRVTLSASVNR